MLRVSVLPMCLLAAALCGAENQEMQNEARTLLPELQRKDVWTALLWEKWAENQGRHSAGNFLENGINIMGSAAFALPEEIRGLKDRGATVEVITKRRWYCFAADGHPCKVPVPFGMLTVEAAAYSFYPGFVSAIGYKYNENGSVEWHQRCLRTDNGELVFETTDTESKITESHTYDPVMADNGSAIAMGWRSDRGSTISVTSPHEQNHRYTNLEKPIGVGRDGCWLIAAQRADDNKGAMVLVEGDDRTQLRAAACGPGVALIMLPDSHTELVGLDGKRSPISLPIGVGENPQLETVGDYLVVGSGRNAVSLDNTDFFGAPLRDPPRQPELVALMRWKDILAGRPRAIASYPGAFSIDIHHSAAITTWKDREAIWIDCSGAAPQAHPFYQAAERIHWAGPLKFMTLVNFGENTNAVLDEAGHELWQGQGTVVTLSSDLALVSQGEGEPGYTLVHLSADPAQRSSQRLNPGRGYWDINADPFRRVVVADRDGTWIKYTWKGEQLAEGGHGKSWPELLLPICVQGRYCYAGGRLFDKFVGLNPPKDAKDTKDKDAKDTWVEDHLMPSDAYLVPSSRSQVALVVLQRFGEVSRYTRGRKGWEWQDAGPCESGFQFAIAQRDNSLVISAADRGHILAEIMDATVNPDDSWDKTSDLPSGPWRVVDMSFVPRNSNSLMWADDAVGFHPVRLRSPTISSPNPLLVVTASLVLSVTQESRLMQILAYAASASAR